MPSNVDRLFNIFGYFFAGFIALLIGYSVVPNLFLFGCCCVVGTLTFIVVLAAVVVWAKSS